jgi:prevent-host-death family protein
MTYKQRMTRFNVHEAKTHLSKLLERVERGEEIEIARNGDVVARLVPSKSQESEPRKLGLFADQIKIHEGFDEVDEQIARDFGMLD